MQLTIFDILDQKNTSGFDISIIIRRAQKLLKDYIQQNNKPGKWEIKEYSLVDFNDNQYVPEGGAVLSMSIDTGTHFVSLSLANKVLLETEKGREYLTWHCRNRISSYITWKTMNAERHLYDEKFVRVRDFSTVEVKGVSVLGTEQTAGQLLNQIMKYEW